MNIKSSIWKKALQTGLIGGVISLLLGVVGMAAAFEKTYLISGVITMGQILVLAPFLIRELFLHPAYPLKTASVHSGSRWPDRLHGWSSPGSIYRV